MLSFDAEPDERTAALVTACCMVSKITFEKFFDRIQKAIGFSKKKNTNTKNEKVIKKKKQKNQKLIVNEKVKKKKNITLISKNNNKKTKNNNKVKNGSFIE